MNESLWCCLKSWPSVDSTKAVAEPTSAITHIQNTAPGPPTAMAVATPARLPVPTREGFEFVGWFADESCTVLVNFDKLPNQSCTLYAKWVEKEAANGCSGSIAHSCIALFGMLGVGVITLFRRKKVQ